MIDPAEESMRESARKTLGQLFRPLDGKLEGLIRCHRIQRGAVGLCGGRNIVRALQTAFDFEAGDSQFRQIGDNIIRRQILRAE